MYNEVKESSDCRRRVMSSGVDCGSVMILNMAISLCVLWGIVDRL